MGVSDGIHRGVVHIHCDFISDALQHTSDQGLVKRQNTERQMLA